VKVLKKGVPSAPEAELPAEDSFARFFNDEFPKLTRYLSRFVGRADAEELAQEAFERVFTDASTTVVRSPRGFVFQIARHLAISHLRRRKLAVATLQLQQAEAAATAVGASMEDALGRFQEIACIKAAVASLPPRRREIVLMRIKDELPYAQIAARAGITVKSVESHIARGLQACEAFFERCASQGCCGKCKQPPVKP